MRRNLVSPHARKRQPRIFNRQNLTKLALVQADEKLTVLPGEHCSLLLSHWPGQAKTFSGLFSSDP